MKSIRTIVFDLDGTIYQNLSFHRDYIGFLTEGTDKASWRDALIAFTERVFSGRALVMNALYKNARLEEADGASPEDFFAALERAYAPEAAAEDMPPKDKYTYLGDAWAVVTLLGETLGLFYADRCNEVYRRTRAKMEEDGMCGDAVLFEAIKRAGERYETVLLSNSYEKTAREFMRQLGFDGAFDRMGFSANKPYGLVEALREQCPRALDEPQSVLTIGDHAFNDLIPLAELGCRTLWINPYEGINTAPHDDTVKTLRELAAYLDALRD